jgi:hypothetical protein
MGVQGATLEDGGDSVEGLREREGKVGLGLGVVGEGERDRAGSAHEGAEQNAGVAVGDAAGAVYEQSAEDGEDGDGNFLGSERDQVAAEVLPGTEAAAPRPQGTGLRLRRVMTAEDVIRGGATAAATSVSEEESAFHGGSPRAIKKAAQGGLFLFCIYKFRISH